MSEMNDATKNKIIEMEQTKNLKILEIGGSLIDQQTGEKNLHPELFYVGVWVNEGDSEEEIKTDALRTVKDRFFTEGERYYFQPQWFDFSGLRDWLGNPAFSISVFSNNVPKEQQTIWGKEDAFYRGIFSSPQIRNSIEVA